MSAGRRSISQILGSQTLQTQLLGPIAEQRRLLEQVRQRLPETVRPHCIGAVPARGLLTLFTTSPAWSSRLRFLGPELLAQLHREGSGFHELRVRVLPPAAPPPRPPPIGGIPRSAAVALHASAEIQRDPDLRAALLRLSAAARDPTGDNEPPDRNR